MCCTPVVTCRKMMTWQLHGRQCWQQWAPALSGLVMHCKVQERQWGASLEALGTLSIASCEPLHFWTLLFADCSGWNI